MPVFEIALEDGRKLRIDADNQQAALAGVEHFIANDKATEAPKAASKAATGGGFLSKLGSAVADSWQHPEPHGLIEQARNIYDAAGTLAKGMPPAGTRREDYTDDPTAPEPNQSAIESATRLAAGAGPITPSLHNLPVGQMLRDNNALVADAASGAASAVKNGAKTVATSPYTYTIAADLLGGHGFATAALKAAKSAGLDSLIRRAVGGVEEAAPGIIERSGPTGPHVASGAPPTKGPWGDIPPPPESEGLALPPKGLETELNKDVRSINQATKRDAREQKVQDQQTVLEGMPLIRGLAKIEKQKAAERAAAAARTQETLQRVMGGEEAAAPQQGLVPVPPQMRQPPQTPDVMNAGPPPEMPMLPPPGGPIQQPGPAPQLALPKPQTIYSGDMPPELLRLMPPNYRALATQQPGIQPRPPGPPGVIPMGAPQEQLRLPPPSPREMPPRATPPEQVNLGPPEDMPTMRPPTPIEELERRAVPSMQSRRVRAEMGAEDASIEEARRAMALVQARRAMQKAEAQQPAPQPVAPPAAPQAPVAPPMAQRAPAPVVGDGLDIPEFLQRTAPPVAPQPFVQPAPRVIKKPAVSEAAPSAAPVSPQQALVNNANNPKGLVEYARKNGLSDADVKALIDGNYSSPRIRNQTYQEYLSAKASATPPAPVKQVDPELKKLLVASLAKERAAREAKNAANSRVDPYEIPTFLQRTADKQPTPVEILAPRLKLYENMGKAARQQDAPNIPEAVSASRALAKANGKTNGKAAEGPAASPHYNGSIKDAIKSAQNDFLKAKGMTSEGAKPDWMVKSLATIERIIGEKGRTADALAKEIPGFDVADFAARYVHSRSHAGGEQLREFMKSKYPQHAATFDKHMNEKSFATIYQNKRSRADGTRP